MGNSGSSRTSNHGWTPAEKIDQNIGDLRVIAEMGLRWGMEPEIDDRVRDIVADIGALLESVQQARLGAMDEMNAQFGIDFFDDGIGHNTGHSREAYVEHAIPGQCPPQNWQGLHQADDFAQPEDVGQYSANNTGQPPLPSVPDDVLLQALSSLLQQQGLSSDAMGLHAQEPSASSQMLSQMLRQQQWSQPAPVSQEPPPLQRMQRGGLRQQTQLPQGSPLNGGQEELQHILMQQRLQATQSFGAAQLQHTGRVSSGSDGSMNSRQLNQWQLDQDLEDAQGHHGTRHFAGPHDSSSLAPDIEEDGVSYSQDGMVNQASASNLDGRGRRLSFGKKLLNSSSQRIAESEQQVQMDPVEEESGSQSNRLGRMPAAAASSGYVIKNTFIEPAEDETSNEGSQMRASAVLFRSEQGLRRKRPGYNNEILEKVEDLPSQRVDTEPMPVISESGGGQHAGY